MELERKDFALKIDQKSLKDDGEFAYFEGYASTFGNEDSYGDVVDPGAFTKTIQEAGATLPMLWQHDTDEVIGVYPSMAEDDHGLLVSGKISLSTQRGREAYALMKMGAIKSMSIGFTTIKDVIDAGIRRLKEVRLWEVSLVTFPANTMAAITQVKDHGGISQLSALVEKLAARIDALEEKRSPEPSKEDSEQAGMAAALAEIRSMLGAATGTPEQADSKADGEPGEAHYLSLIREMRSDVESALQATG